MRGRTRYNNPDAIEVILVVALAIWTISVFYLLRQAATFGDIGSIVSWTSLSAFFTGFGSIALIVIAIMVADIRKLMLK